MHIPNFTYSPAPPPSRITYIFEWSTRFDKPLFEHQRNRQLLLEAITATAVSNRVKVLEVAATESNVQCTVSAPATLSPSVLLARFKNTAAISLRRANPELRAGVFRRSGRIDPIAPKQVPTNAEPDSSEPESLAVSGGGADSTASALSGSATHSLADVSESSDA